MLLNVWEYYLFITFLQDIPVLIVLGFVYFVCVDLLTPNPRKYGKVLGWLFLELFEHILLPLIIIITVIFCGPCYLIVLLATIVLVYGRVLGNAKEDKDWIKVFALFFVFVTTLFIPDFTYFIDKEYGIEGWISLSIIGWIILMIYIYEKRFYLKNCNFPNK